MSPFIVVLVGLVCLGIGIGLGLWFASMRQSISAGKADEVQRAFDDYKSEVNSHFADTAKHFSAIGNEYRALYNHMASGAESLLGSESSLGADGFPTLIAEQAASEAHEDATTPPATANEQASEATLANTDHSLSTDDTDEDKVLEVADEFATEETAGSSDTASSKTDKSDSSKP